MHIQELGIDAWKQATDEEHIQGLFQQSNRPEPRWVGYLEHNRPHVMNSGLTKNTCTNFSIIFRTYAVMVRARARQA